MKNREIIPIERAVTAYAEPKNREAQRRYEERLRELKRQQGTYRKVGRPKDQVPRHMIGIRVTNEEELIIRELIAEFRKLDYPL